MAGNSWFNHNECLQSCALAGAAAMAAGITDAYIVANGPTWCYFYAMKVTDRPGLNLDNDFYARIRRMVPLCSVLKKRYCRHCLI